MGNSDMIRDDILIIIICKHCENLSSNLLPNLTIPYLAILIYITDIFDKYPETGFDSRSLQAYIRILLSEDM